MKHIALLLACCLGAPIHAATIYNCNGTYQQTPCADGEGATVNVSGAGAATSPSVQNQAMVEEYRRKAWASGLIARRRVAPNMTSDEVRRAWGAPTTVNRTLTATGEREQWVYRRGRVGADYVYLDDGMVTTIQQAPGMRDPQPRCPTESEMRELKMAAGSRIQYPAERQENMRRLEQAEACLRRQ